jgi:hypothetical protein
MIIGDPQNASDDLPVNFGVGIHQLRLVSTSVQMQGVTFSWLRAIRKYGLEKCLCLFI